MVCTLLEAHGTQGNSKCLFCFASHWSEGLWLAWGWFYCYLCRIFVIADKKCRYHVHTYSIAVTGWKPVLEKNKKIIPQQKGAEVSFGIVAVAEPAMKGLSQQVVFLEQVDSYIKYRNKEVEVTELYVQYLFTLDTHC